MTRVSSTLLILACTFLSTTAQDHHHGHDHGQDPARKVTRPRVFLDKNLRIVKYQLDRLKNDRLLLVSRSTDHPKYAPVYAAILTRAGMSRGHREEALEALVTINKSDATTELLDAMESLDPSKRQQQRTVEQLAKMLLGQPAATLGEDFGSFLHASGSSNSLLRPVAYAALVTGGEADAAWMKASQSEEATMDWLRAIQLIPRPDVRTVLRPRVVELTDPSRSADVRRSALTALGYIPFEQAETFRLASSLFTEPKLRAASVATLLRIAPDQRDPDAGQKLVDELVGYAEETPAEQRTTDDFVDAMQLTDQLMKLVPVEQARSYRDRLRAVTVRVVRINTVNEEMRYDTPYFAVEAGRPVQVVLNNRDLMPHNFVITIPGALKDVAELGLAAGVDGGVDGKQYVPDSPKVLHSTDMVQPGQQERLTFTAPTAPGEYPYVCTFPRHWMRMYGVMVVVEDLDQWLNNPVEPEDPVGNNRSFVKAWTIDDLKDELADGLRGRSAEIGHRIFTEATCAQCHTIKDEGGRVGPELTDVFERWKGDRVGVLREILEPSHRIDPKYSVHLIVTSEGKTISGIVQAENKRSVSVLVNPEAKEPINVPRSEIDEMLKTSTSMMPKALLDRFTRDEIFELLAFLESAQKE